MTFVPISASDFRREPPQVPWIVKGLVAQGALTVLAGVGGLGKSSLALALAAAVCRGDSVYAGFQIPTDLRRMMYVDAENGVHEMHRRAHCFDIFDGFYEFAGNLEDETRLLGIYAAEMGPGLIVLDSCRALYPGMDEDNSKSVLPILLDLQHTARETNCGILLLHHTTKGGSIFRGSGEFQNRPEITVTMRKDGRGNRYLDWEKCRLGVEPPRKYLRLNDENGRLRWREGQDIPSSTTTYDETFG
jgi:hypothetical protein